MKVTVKMLQDLGVCGPASIYVGQWFIDNNIEIIDYDLGMKHLKSLIGHGQEWINANVADEDHADYINWIQWYANLPSMPEAIMYFGDHIEENLYITPDGFLHESLESAKEYIKRMYQEMRDDHQSKRVINGIKIGPSGAETWEQIDLATADLSQYQEFVWHDSNTGLNNRTTSPTVAAIFDAEQRKVLDLIDAAERAVVIKRKITDSDNKYSVWVEV